MFVQRVFGPATNLQAWDRLDGLGGWSELTGRGRCSIIVEDAQWAVDKLITGGAKAILSLSPTVVSVPPGVAVRNSDLAGELIMLSCCHDDSQNDA